MGRRKKAPGRRISTRRTHKDDRKQQIHMDIVVGAVRRLGSLGGVSLTDIEHIVVTDGDIPAHAGAKNILRQGLNRAVRLGRLQKLPGGLFCLPNNEDIDTGSKLEADLSDVSNLSADRGLKNIFKHEAASSNLSRNTPFGAGKKKKVGAYLDGGTQMNADIEEDQTIFFPEVSSRVSTTKARPFKGLRDAAEEMDDADCRDADHNPASDDGPTGRERTAAEHGRMAAAGLFKLSSDILAVIAHTTSARLSGEGDGGRAGGGDDPSTDRDEDDDEENSNMPNGIAGPSRRENRKEKSGPMCDGRGSNLALDSRQVVKITGTAFTEISAASAQGSLRVLEAAANGDPDSSIDAATRDNIFRTFKEAAMDIVQAARAFGAALGDAVNDDRQRSERSQDSQVEDYDSLPLHVGSELSAMNTDQRLDVQDFLRSLLQNVRELVQRIGN